MFDFRFIRFLVVGLANTLVGLLIIYACMWTFNMDYIPANAIGYTTGIILGFALNKKWTFEHKGKCTPAFYRFLVVLTLAYFVNLITVAYAIEHLNFDNYLAQALGIAPYTLLNYIGSRYFAFGEKYS